MTRIHHPASIPGLLGVPPADGYPIVLDPNGDVLLGSGSVVDYGEVMKWQGRWTAGCYLEGDVVLDGDWTMVANKDTCDRAAPTPDGSPEFSIDPDPAWVTMSPTVTYLGTGTRFLFAQGGWGLSWRVWNRLGQ